MKHEMIEYLYQIRQSSTKRDLWHLKNSQQGHGVHYGACGVEGFYH